MVNGAIFFTGIETELQQVNARAKAITESK
jgi:hypothetical protein